MNLKSARLWEGVLAAANNPTDTDTDTDGDLRADPLADHRRARAGRAREPGRGYRAPRGQGLAPEEALGEAEGEEDLPFRQQGGRGVRRGKGHRGSGRVQGHGCKRQDLRQGPEAARRGAQEGEGERFPECAAVLPRQRAGHLHCQGLRSGGEGPPQGREGSQAYRPRGSRSRRAQDLPLCGKTDEAV